MCVCVKKKERERYSIAAITTSGRPTVEMLQVEREWDGVFGRKRKRDKDTVSQLSQLLVDQL